jgi:hypothetical protein
MFLKRRLNGQEVANDSFRVRDNASGIVLAIGTDRLYDLFSGLTSNGVLA